MNLEQHMAEAYVRSLVPDVIILPSSSSDAYDNEEDHMRALAFHKAIKEAGVLAREYGFKVVLKNLTEEELKEESQEW